MTDLSWSIPYIHGEAHDTGRRYTATSLNKTFSICLNGECRDLEPQDFLRACWTNGFETPCCGCAKSFGVETKLPVRLLQADLPASGFDPLTETLPTLHIKNFHMECLQPSRVKFISVTHPWHPSIAEAYAQRTVTAEAAQVCFEIPVRTLLAILRHFGPEHLVWHDYISIPQWDPARRGEVILPRIFKIFSASSTAILHVDSAPPKSLACTSDTHAMCDYDVQLRRFCKTHLFTRLWPVVELDRAGEAYMMNNKYEITSYSFSLLLRQLALAQETIATLAWTYDLPLFLQEKQEHKCLGYVFDMIAEQGCRSYRDKMIAAAELLNISDYPSALPQEAEAACLWLAEKQLSKGDVTPLLLGRSDEGVYHQARWLRGHTGMSRGIWGWGAQISHAKNVPRLHGHRVTLDLHLIGEVSTQLSWGERPISSRSFSVPDLANWLSTLTNESLEDFQTHVDAADHGALFQLDRPGHDGDEFSIDIDISGSELLSAVLRHLLVHNRAAIESGSVIGVDRLCDKVRSLLALSASTPKPSLDHFRDFSTSRALHHLVDHREQAFLWVSCPSCHIRSLLRAEIWQRSISIPRLYIVPGVAYQYTASEGVGLIIDGDHIVGRARFCAVPCCCVPSVAVEIH